MWSKEEIIGVWKNWCVKAVEFKLNPDDEFVGKIADGVLMNQESYGQKFCPCRVRDGTRARDLELLCPCNFMTHSTWSHQNRCWCGLFVKKE